MTKGIEISFLSNTRDLVKGGKDTEKTLEKVADALDDMTRDGDAATTKLERGFKDVSKDARKASGDIDSVGDSVKNAGRKGADFDNDMRKGTAGAGAAVEEFGNEATQNMSETFSSFRGEGEDFVQIIQDTFGGVMSGLGPLGMAFGAAGAVGIGLFMGEQERAKEQTAEFKAEAGELAAKLIEIGDDPADAIAAVAERLKELATTSEEGEVNLADLRTAASTSVSGFRRLADAYAGNTAELKKMRDAEQERLSAAEAAFDQDKRWDAATTERLRKARDGQRTIVDGLDETIKVTEAAEAQESAWLASNGPAYEARAQQLEAIQNELNDSIGSWTEYQHAETGSLDPGAFIAGMAAKREAIANFNTNVQTIAQEFGLSQEETQAILDQGLDFAPHLQSIMNSGFAGAYATEVRAAVSGGQSIVDGTPITSTVKTDADTSAAETKLKATAKNRDAKVEAKSETKTAAKQLDDLAGKSRTATIRASADTYAAARAIDRLVENRIVTIRARVIDQRGQEVP